jgi:hypothetical protein
MTYGYIKRNSDGKIFAAQFTGDALVAVLGPIPDWQADSDPKGFDWTDDASDPAMYDLEDDGSWTEFVPVQQPN